MSNKLIQSILSNRKAKENFAKNLKAKVSLSAVPVVDDPSLQTWIKSIDRRVRESNQNGLTAHDLVEYGLVDKSGNAITSTNQDTQIDLTIPKAVLNLSANAAYSSITLAWETAKNKSFGHNAVYRSGTDDFGVAVHIGSTVGDIYTDYVGSNIKAFYWVRTISKHSVEGDLSPSVTAKTSMDIDYVLDQLKDKITNNQLSSSLNQEIEKITDLKDSITTQYAGADDEYAGDDRISAGHISEETLRIEGDKATAKLVDQLDLKYKADGQEVRAIIQEETNARVTEQEAMAQTLDLLVVAVNEDIAAAIQEESTVRATQNSAMSQKITTLETDLNGNSLKIQEAITSIDGINGEWRVSIDQNGNVSGVSLGVNGDESQFTIIADRFVLTTPSGEIALPFTMDEDGKIIIDTALIKNGSIQNAQISELNADKITTGSLSADVMKGNIVEAVEGQFTKLSAITATIGHLRTATTGARTEIQDNLIQVFDSSGRVRVKIGVWEEG